MGPKLLWSGEVSAPGSTITIKPGLGTFVDYEFLVIRYYSSGTEYKLYKTGLTGDPILRAINLTDTGTLTVSIYETLIKPNTQYTVFTVSHNSAVTKSVSGTWSRNDAGPTLIQAIYGLYPK